MTTVSSQGEVEFRFFRPHSASAGVAGDFNGWHADRLPMQPQGNGWWTARATFPPGEYRFRYNIDGHWFTDYASYGVERGPLGYNSMLIIPKQRHVSNPAQF
jgi:1,4-alpha-glucan branching enzyme